jgi:TRAP-type mannitol/chloroaromatic compound transport system permease small subunit
MGFLLNFANVFDRIARSVGKAAGWIILLLIFTIMFDVVTRKIDVIRLYFSDFTIEYGYSVSTILQDLEWHLHGVLLLLTFGFGYLMNAHVRVDIFRENFSRRGQAWMEFWGLIVLALPFMILMLYFAWRFAAISWHQGEGSESMTGIPWRYVVKSFRFIGFCITTMAILSGDSSSTCSDLPTRNTARTRRWRSSPTRIRHRWRWRKPGSRPSAPPIPSGTRCAPTRNKSAKNGATGGSAEPCGN